MIRELCDVEQVDPWVKWGHPKSYLLKYFAMIPLQIVLEYQADTNMYCSKHNQQSSNWLYIQLDDCQTLW